MTLCFSAVALLLATGFVHTDGLMTPTKCHVLSSNRPHTLKLPSDGLSLNYGYNRGELSACVDGVLGSVFFCCVPHVFN